MMKRLRCAVLALSATGLTALAAAPAVAGDEIVGQWQRSDGASRIRMTPCGGAVCGHVSWLKNPADSPAKVGQQIFFGMKPSGAGAWAGNAFNPEDGKTYSGSATVSGASMVTKGCALGGLICRSYSWSRI